MARVYRSLHLGILHQPKVVDRHYYVNPVEFGRNGQTLRHVLVSTEAKQAYQPSLLCAFGPFLQLIGQLVGIKDVVDTKIYINVLDIHSFQRGLQVLFYILYIWCRRSYVWRLTYDDQSSAGFHGLREEFAYAKLAVSTCIVRGCIPTSYTPAKRVSQQNLVIEEI